MWAGVTISMQTHFSPHCYLCSSVAKTTFNGGGIEANLGNLTCLNLQQIGQPPLHLTSWEGEIYLQLLFIQFLPKLSLPLFSHRGYIQHKKFLHLE